MQLSAQNRFCIPFVIAAALVLVVCGMEAPDAMNPELSDQAEFQVIGIEARTNNSREADGHSAIPKQWHRLFVEDVLNRIPDRLDQSIVAVYTNYASDWNGDYTYILGAKVKPGAEVPDGMVSVKVPTGKYVEFISTRGVPSQVVPETWRQIWSYFQEPGHPPRDYEVDFERYDDMSDPSNVQVRIYIGIKP